LIDKNYTQVISILSPLLIIWM